MGLIREKLAVAQGFVTAFNVLAMNLQKVLELLYVLLAYSLHLVLGYSAALSSLRALSHQRPAPEHQPVHWSGIPVFAR